MHKTVVINIVGLTPKLLKHAKHLRTYFSSHKPIKSMLPAVTCSVQATYTTGVLPNQHGIVGNGWYFKDLCEVMFWKQSNKLVQHEAVWDTARKRNKDFTCANMFWWYNMYSTVDYSITPRPMYPADGRKLPDIYTEPATLRHALQQRHGMFPLFHFWGPKADIRSTQWIADASIYADKKYNPTLTFIYLPHLDYPLQKYGPDDPCIAKEVAKVDRVFAQLATYYAGSRIIVLSEYGIVPVDTPIHINRVLRKKGLLRVREELGRELLDPGASDAFAVADHQVAHVYVNNKARRKQVKALLERMRHVDLVLDTQRQHHGLAHERSGDFVLVAKKNAWFTYYYWYDDKNAPDFARTVDIHRKPGYDPVELFMDEKKAAKMKAGAKLLKKKLGFRGLLDVIPLDAGLVKGSHGRLHDVEDEGPLLLSSKPSLLPRAVPATRVASIILDHVFR